MLEIVLLGIGLKSFLQTTILLCDLNDVHLVAVGKIGAGSRRSAFKSVKVHGISSFRMFNFIVIVIDSFCRCLSDQIGSDHQLVFVHRVKHVLNSSFIVHYWFLLGFFIRALIRVGRVVGMCQVVAIFVVVIKMLEVDIIPKIIVIVGMRQLKAVLFADINVCFIVESFEAVAMSHNRRSNLSAHVSAG